MMPPCTFNKSEDAQDTKEQERLLNMRQKWLMAVALYPGTNGKALRAREPAVYMWLYRHDNAWLGEHMPIRTKKINIERVDWAKRDSQLAAQIAETSHALRVHPGRSIRLSIAAISRAVGREALLQQHADKLPKATQALIQNAEGRLEFALRRIKWSVDRYKAEQQIPKRWEMVRRAGIGRLMGYREVEVALVQALEQLTENR